MQKLLNPDSANLASAATGVPFRPPLIPLSIFARSLSKTPSTIWRWRKSGWLETVNIAGKVYVSSQAVAEFVRRAEAGEFSKQAVVPRNKV